MGKLLLSIVTIIVLFYHASSAVSVQRRDDCGGCEIVSLFKGRAIATVSAEELRRAAGDRDDGKVYMFRKGGETGFTRNLTRGEALDMREDEVQRIRNERLDEVRFSLVATFAGLILLVALTSLVNYSRRRTLRKQC